MLITTNNILFAYNFKKQFTIMYSAIFFWSCFGLVLVLFYKIKKYSYTIDIRIYVWYNINKYI